MLISEVSAGKTFISMAALEHHTPTLSLVVAPLTALDVTWAPKLLSLPHTTLHRSWTSFKNRAPGSRHILLIHFQLLAKLNSTKSKKLERVPWDLVIIDESQNIKDRNSKTSRAARRLRHASRRLALSATPLDASPIDLWAQMRFVDHEEFGDDFKDFEQDYCYRGGYKDKDIIFRSNKLPALLRRLSPYILRLDKTFLNLKPIHIHPVPVLLLSTQRALYERMNEHGIVFVNGAKIRAPLKVTKQVKLEQITGGTIKEEYFADERRRERSHHIGNAKLRKLRALVEKLDPPIVIFCKYLAEIPLIEEVLAESAPGSRPARVAKLTGAVIGDNRTALINNFQAGQIDYLIAQMRTGGVSIELTAASTLIFYSMNFSLIDFEQIIGRVHRGSQTREVNVYILYAQDTVDQQIVEDIEDKKSTFYAVVDHFIRPSPAPSAGP